MPPLPRPILPVLLAGALFALAGCNAVPPHVLLVAPASENDRDLQTRRYAGIKESDLLAAGAAVVQDLGFTLDESESKLGLITASRRLTSNRPLSTRELMGGVAWAVLQPYVGGPMLAYNAVSGVKEPQLVRVSLASSAAGTAGQPAASVRVTAQRVVYADEAQAKVRSVEPLNAPEFYDEFFRRLAKSVFLEGQKNAL